MSNQWCVIQLRDGSFSTIDANASQIQKSKVLETGQQSDMNSRAKELNQTAMPCVYSVGQMYISTGRNEVISIYKIVEIIEQTPDEWERRNLYVGHKSMAHRFSIKGELILSNFRKPKSKRRETLHPAWVGEIITKEWIQEKMNLLKELEACL